MGIYPLNSKTKCHLRSISLSSRPHPLSFQYSEHLSRLNSAQTASSSSSTSSPDKLGALEDLYESAHAFVLLPLNQQEMSRANHSRSVDESLERSLALLEVIGATKDTLALTKEIAEALQSILRRRRAQGLAETSIVCDLFATRRTIKKLLHKFHKSSRQIERRFRSSVDRDEPSSMSIARIFKDMEAATVSALRFALENIYGVGRMHLRPRGWSLIPRMLQPKPMVFEEAVLDCEVFEMVAANLVAARVCKQGKTDNFQFDSVLANLQKLESAIQDGERKLESLFRKLIKMRVAILNVQNNL